MERLFEGPMAYAEYSENGYDVYVFRGDDRWLLTTIHAREPVRARKVCQLLNDNPSYTQGMLHSLTGGKDWSVNVTYKLEKCPRCKKKTLNRENCGESEIYRSRHVLCVPCWREESEEVEREGTNDLPLVLNSYGPPNDF